jgi:putative N6-adenine-specific DNA methylase
MRDLVRLNLRLRTAMRVLLTLREGPVRGRDDLYALAASVPWEEWLDVRSTFAVEVAGPAPGFDHRGFAALVVKDALVDRLRDRLGMRPDVDRDDPDIRVHVHLGSDGATLALDSSGQPLSQRGWRPMGGPAPLTESLAAGMLLLAGYDGSQPFLDPMCGTGTLAIEAALIATDRAPGADRPFALERWRVPGRAVVAAERARARDAVREAPAPVVAGDCDPRAVAAARRNARAARVGGIVRVVHRDVRDLEIPGPGTVIVTNPPYGQRLGVGEDLESLYRDLGSALKRRAPGSVAWILTGAPSLARLIGLRPQRRVVLFNGPIECRLLRFDIVEGRLAD